MHHYEKYDDNVYRDDDFSWFIAMAKEEKEKSITPVSHTHAYKKKDTESSKIHKEDVKKELDKKPVHGSGAAILGSYRNSPVKDIEVSEEDYDLGILKPEVEVEKKKPTYTVKERLSEKEDSRNKDLLEDLRSKYEECIAFIRDMCNSQYRIILNMMEDAYNQNIYKVQFCPMYLEISEDRKTSLYHKLYEVDVATVEFQKEVVHRYGIKRLLYALVPITMLAFTILSSLSGVDSYGVKREKKHTFECFMGDEDVPLSDTFEIDNKRVIAKSALDMCNDIRKDMELIPLKWDFGLEESAAVRSEEASTFWSHTRPNGDEWWTVA